MIALFDFPPRCCPVCGGALKHSGLTRQEFYAGISFSCGCGLAYQFVGERDLLDAATDAGGDLEQAMRLAK